MLIFDAVNNSRMIFGRCTAAVCAVLLLAGCSHDPLTIDTSGVTLDIRYSNLDSALATPDSAALTSTIMNQRSRTPEIIDYQLGFCFRVGGVTDPGMISRLQAFRNEPYVQRLEKRIEEKFRDLPQRHRKITEGLKKVKAHLPEAPMPAEIVYLNSYFASSAFCTHDAIAIGLERYLGAKTDVIAELPPQDFYPWIKEKMDAQYLERDAVAAWIMTHLVEVEKSENNIDAMIRWGKIVYLTEAAFPDMPEHWILRYSEADYQKALDSERPFWDFLVKQKMLFGSDEATQAGLLNDAPFTSGLPEKAPDRLGQFLGWRIIHSYMEQNDVTLQQLMKIPYTELLQEYEITD
jgi:hypothetical protein